MEQKLMDNFLNGNSLIKISFLFLSLLVLSSCGDIDGCADCSAEMNQVKSDLGEPDNVVEVLDDGNIHIWEYVYLCEGISYTFIWGSHSTGCSDRCNVEINTFTPICE